MKFKCQKINLVKEIKLHRSRLFSVTYSNLCVSNTIESTRFCFCKPANENSEKPIKGVGTEQTDSSLSNRHSEQLFAELTS